MSASPILSVVIPTWNRRDLVETCLASLEAQTFRDFEVLVVDDGSTDDTVAYLRTNHPEVSVVACESNGGFAAAANRGLAQAQGEWMLLLNNDVTLAKDCLEKLMAAAQAGTAAMLTPLVLWTEDPRLIYSAGDVIGRNGRPASVGFKTKREALAMNCEPFGVSGGYGLFKRELLEAVGLLDTAFTAYFEDSDLCFRARWAGFSAALVPDALAWHVGSATISNRLWWRTRQCYRNHALLVLKNYSLPMLRWNAGALVRERCHQFTRVFSVARSEWGSVRAIAYTISAWLGLMVRVPGALVRRRGIMARRKVSSAAMQALLTHGDGP